MRIPSQAGEPGPGFIPLALAVLLAALSVAIVVGGLLRSADAAETPQSGAGPSLRVAKPWLAALATFAYAAVFQPLGFVLSTLAYSGYLASLFTRDRKRRAAVPVFVTLALFVFFRLALGVRLPMGLLGP